MPPPQGACEAMDARSVAAYDRRKQLKVVPCLCYFSLPPNPSYSSILPWLGCYTRSLMLNSRAGGGGCNRWNGTGSPRGRCSAVGPRRCTGG